MPEGCPVTCSHRSATFSLNENNTSLGHCSNCRKLSHIRLKLARATVILYVAIGILCLLSEIGCATGYITSSRIPGGNYVVDTLVFLVALSCFSYGYYFYRLKISVLSSGDPV